MTNTVVVKLTQDAQLDEVGFFIEQVQNPGAVVDSEAIGVKILDPLGSTIDSTSNLGSSTFSVGLAPEQLRSVQIENTNKIVGEYGQLIVTIEPSHLAHAKDIRIKFPRWDTEYDLVSYFKDDACKLIHDSRSTINPEATCELTQEFSEDFIEIKNAVTQSPITIVLDGIRNAPSTRGTVGIEVYTHTTEGYLIEQMLDLGFKPSQPAVFPASNLELSLLDSQVATLTNLSAVFTFKNPVPAGGIIKITFPPEIKVRDAG